MAGADASASSVDMRTGDLAAAVDLAPVAFFPDIQADIDQGTGGCSIGACHGVSNAPVLTAMPSTSMAQSANYAAFISNCDTSHPEMSKIIRSATNADGTHGGGTVFAVGSAQYARWAAWIAAGEREFE